MGHGETGTARLAAYTSGQRVGRDRRRNAFQGVGTDAVAGFVFSEGRGHRFESCRVRQSITNNFR